MLIQLCPGRNNPPCAWPFLILFFGSLFRGGSFVGLLGGRDLVLWSGFSLGGSFSFWSGFGLGGSFSFRGGFSLWSGLGGSFFNGLIGHFLLYGSGGGDPFGICFLLGLKGLGPGFGLFFVQAVLLGLDQILLFVQPGVELLLHLFLGQCPCADSAQQVVLQHNPLIGKDGPGGIGGLCPVLQPFY